LIYQMATIISDEARAKHHEFFRNNEFGRYKGLTFWSPNINIFRDPRWGRGQETYGEDPYLTSKLGVAFVKGLQGNDSKYLKVVATPKHYAVHSGPEKDRHRFNAIVSLKDLRETYLPHFKECVIDGKAYSVMGAYNRTNNEACCASTTLLQKILREEWGFQGYVVSDCGAIRDIHRNHKITTSPEESAALALKNGCDLDCGITFKKLGKALKRKLISEADIDRSVKRLFLARFKLGMFDPPTMVPYAQIPFTVNDCEKHRQFALQVARETIVLLKNDKSLLPLKKDFKKIAVIGPNADNLDSLLGNYNGTPSKYVTPLQGIRNKLPNSEILYAEGCSILKGSEESITSAVKIAQESEIVIACMGISPKF
jgi:beta-glucosidase